MHMKAWLKVRSDSSHDNLRRKEAVSLPLDCRVYLQKFPSTFGTLLKLLHLLLKK
jgi:hypothetical protein